MNEPTMETLARRVDKVERENRQWKAIGISVMAVLGLAFFLVVAGVGQTQVRVEDEVRAKSFILLNKNNEVSARLASFVDGSPWLSLNNQGAEISLIVDSVGPRLSFWSKDRFNKVWLTIEADGSPRLSLSRNLVPRAVLIVEADGPSLTLTDKKERPQAILNVDPDGIASLAFSDKFEKVRAAFGVNTDGSPVLFMTDKAEQNRVSLSVLGGTGNVSILGKDGKEILGAP